MVVEAESVVLEELRSLMGLAMLTAMELPPPPPCPPPPCSKMPQPGTAPSRVAPARPVPPIFRKSLRDIPGAQRTPYFIRISSMVMNSPFSARRSWLGNLEHPLYCL